MDLPVILEVVIGLIFVYLLMAILCSGVNEWCAQYVARRGEFLKQGLNNILGDRWMYLRVLNHPVVSSLYRDKPGKVTHPSYLPSNNFALALFDVLRIKARQLTTKEEKEKEEEEKKRQQAAAAANGQPAITPEQEKTAELLRAAGKCADYGYHIAMAVKPLIESASGDLGKAISNVETWYDSSMERVSGWYKRKSQFMLAIIAAILTVLLNVDSIAIARALSENEELRKSVVEAAVAKLEAEKEKTSSAAPPPATTPPAGAPPSGTPPAAAPPGGDAAAPPERSVEAIKQDIDDVIVKMQAFEKEGLPVGFSCLGSPSELLGTGDSGATAGAGEDADTYAKHKAVAKRCMAAAGDMFSSGNWFMKLIGLLITVFAVTLGAPFWFDMLNKVINLRSAGGRPGTAVSPPSPAGKAAPR